MRSLVPRWSVPLFALAAFGCTHLSPGGRSVDLSVGEPGTTIESKNSEANANTPAKLAEPVTLDAKLKFDPNVGRGASAKSTSKPSVEAVVYRNTSGVLGDDGVFEAAAKLRPARVDRVENKPDSAALGIASEVTLPEKVEPNPHRTQKEVGSSALASVTISPPPPLTPVHADHLPKPDDIKLSANPAGTLAADSPVPRVEIEKLPTATGGLPPDVLVKEEHPPRKGSESQSIGKLASADASSTPSPGRPVPRAQRQPTSSRSNETDKEGLALTDTTETESSEVLELVSHIRPGVTDDGQGVAAAESATKCVPAATTTAAANEDLSRAKSTAANALEVVPPAPIVARADGNSSSVESGSTLSAQSSKLRLARFHLCSEILGFGNTVPPASKELEGGQPSLAYVEVEGLGSRRCEDGFESHLSCQMSLERTSGEVAWHQDFDEIVDRCHDRRKDFFCHFVFTVPPELSPGTYMLRLRVLDTVAASAGEATLRVEVVSQR